MFFPPQKKNRCKIIDHTYDFRSNPSLRFILLNAVSACLSLLVIQTHYTFRFPIFNSKANNYVVFELNISLCITFKLIYMLLNTEILPNVPEYINHLNDIIKLCSYIKRRKQRAGTQKKTTTLKQAI